MEIIQYYAAAKAAVISLGYAEEIVWQDGQRPSEVTESDFLREAAWVVYCSGFREETVSKYFDFISLCFCEWNSALEIQGLREQCIGAAMLAFRSRRKHEAVATIAARIAETSFLEFRHSLLIAPIPTIRTLPFMGKITSIHLAKNLGFEVAKPDRHLVRLQAEFGYKNVSEMCQEISDSCGDPIRVVDVVLWRYLERINAGTKGFRLAPH